MRNHTANNGMPRLIPDTSFNTKLSGIANNLEHTRLFLEKGAVDFALPGFTTPYGYRLVKSSSGNEQYRLITDSSEPETAYAVKLEFMRHIVPGKKTCTQIMVWRTSQPQHRNAIRGLAAEFFQHFLSLYQIVVSDSEQTADGRRFWEDMIAWAMGTPGYHVYVSDGTEEDRPLTRMNGWDDFYPVWSNFCYGHDPDCHSHRLLVISNDQLH